MRFHPRKVSPDVRHSPMSRIAIVFALIAFATSAGADVILSELCDPQANYTTDRYIEIYNSGPSAVSLTDWKVVAVGNNAEVCTWNLSGMLAVGQAKVCGGPSTVTGFTVDFPNAAWATPNSQTVGFSTWNGNINDGARLKNASGTVIDEVVMPTDGIFKDQSLVRNANITSPRVGYLASEWTGTPVTLATDASPGTHNGSLPPPGGPVFSNVVTDPAVPAPDENIDVEASVVDTSTEILSVALAWGLSSGSQPNVIGMNLVSGDTYRTGAPIPPQSGGVVYYRISASDSFTTKSTSLLSYNLGTGGTGSPTVLSVGETSDSTLLVFFSEPVDPVTAEMPTNYTVGALSGVAAVRDPVQTSQVLVTLRGLTAGALSLTVNGVADLSNNVGFGVTKGFTYIDVTIPAGYYDGTAGLKGSALIIALHDIIKGHTVKSYAYALTAFAITDVKPNGKIWDVYSDVPGGTPPYEYSVGGTGQGATEGMGYNREHSFPQSWFNSVSPMVSDLNMLYPTDAKVNGYRGNFAYGMVGDTTHQSLNGSKLGTCISPNYDGGSLDVFEPIDAYKGDLARTQFYVASRYFTEDQSWPGGPETYGANLRAWAADQYLAWSVNDPVSWKERMRNGAIWTIQNNRNPFIDHPEFVSMIYDSNAVVASVGGSPRASGIQLRQNRPNPFAAHTTIGFDLARGETVSLAIFDIAGREVSRLMHGTRLNAGSHSVTWDGRDAGGTPLRAGLYFCRLCAGDVSDTKRMVLDR